MEGEPVFNQAPEEEIVDGVKYRKVDSGYTLRQYYSHDTPEKGAGPGWDYRWNILEKYGVNEPSELPEDPHYVWQKVEEDK